MLVGDLNTDYDYDDFIIRIGGYLQWDDLCELDGICPPEVQ